MQLEQYPEAILLLRDIRDGQFLLDAKRYLLLAYVNIGQYDALEDIISILVYQDEQLPHDFFTLFDIFFYKPLREDTSAHVYELFSQQATIMIDRCYEKIDDTYAYICLR
jgi:hypothetical protein